jgi:23S rRNA (uracil1939-C5)-methyltransferase
MSLSPHLDDLIISRWANGGDGITVPQAGPLAGLVIFVPKVVPGDRVDVRITKQKKRWARGEVRTLRQPSPDRVTAPCVYAASCGGCPWMNGSVELQAENRRTILLAEVGKRFGWSEKQALSRVALDSRPHKTLGYRNRVRLAFRCQNKQVKLGFRGARQHRLIDIQTCVVADEAIQNALPQVRAAIMEAGLTAGEVLLVSGEQGVAGLITTPSGEQSFGLKETHVLVGSARIPSAPRMFLQGNPEVASHIAQDIEAVAREAGGSRATELFAGVGSFTVPLLKAGYEVDAYDVSDMAASFAEVTKPFGEARYIQSDLLRDHGPVPSPTSVDLVLLDPPRSGAAEVMTWIASTKAAAVLMVSCDIASGLRDARTLMDHGYRCESVRGYDLFPHTGHQELLIHLVKV